MRAEFAGRLLDLAARQIVIKVDGDPCQHLSGAELQSQYLGHGSYPGIPSRNALNRLADFRTCGFARQKATGFTRQKYGHQHQQDSDSDRGDAIGQHPAENLRERNSHKGNEKPRQRGGIFQDNCEYRWVFAGTDRAQERLLGVALAEFAIGSVKRYPFKHRGSSQDAIVYPDVLKRFRRQDFHNAFVDLPPRRLQ